jgi:hypothetical protein
MDQSTSLEVAPAGRIHKKRPGISRPKTQESESESKTRTKSLKVQAGGSGGVGGGGAAGGVSDGE